MRFRNQNSESHNLQDSCLRRAHVQFTWVTSPRALSIPIEFLMNLFLNYDIKNLIMKQKPQPRAVDLKLTRIGQVDGVDTVHHNDPDVADGQI